MRLRIAELDALDPPQWLDGDELHPTAPETRLAYFGRDGRPLPGDAGAQARESWRQKCEPGGLTQTVIGLEGGTEIVVSTAYLGIDVGFYRSRTPYPPIVWETMIFFDGWDDNYQWRYATQNAAMDNHRKVVEIICRHTGAHVTEERDRAPGWGTPQSSS